MEDVERINDDNSDVPESAFDSKVIKLSNEGIDVRKLRVEKEAEFEINPDTWEDEYANTYFDNEEVFRNLNFECTSGGKMTDEEEKTPFEVMGAGMIDISPAQDGKILKKILKQGTGNVVPAGAKVKVHYNGYLEFSEEPFDSSRLRGKPDFLTLGTGQHIMGWEIGVATMKKGETSRFLIAPDYAYGRMGCPPRIPRNSSVMFEIEVISFVDRAAADAYESSPPDEAEKTTFENICNIAKSLREVGNDAFKNKRYGHALKSYRKGARLLEMSRLANEDEENIKKDLCLVLYLNSSLCCLNLKEYGRCIEFARQALDIDSRNVKALFRLGKAQLQVGETERARKSLLSAQGLDPGNKEISNEILQLDNQIKKSNELEKTMFRKMFHTETNPGKSVDKKPSDETSNKGLLDYVIKKINDFKEDSTETELPLPACLNSTEKEAIVQLAQKLQLSLVKSDDGKILAVTK